MPTVNGKKNTVGLKNMKVRCRVQAPASLLPLHVAYASCLLGLQYGAVADHILKMTMSSGAKVSLIAVLVQERSH